MKKTTLLIISALLAAMGVNARSEKTLEFKMTDSDFNVSYTGTNSCNAETGELSLSANASCAWDRYYAATKFDLSSSERFVVKLQEAATQDLFVVLSTDGFWGTVGDAGTGYIGTLKAGETELTIALAGLTNNNEGKTKYGETIDLSKINMINLWSGGAGGACTYKLDEVYAERSVTGYDEVVKQDTYQQNNFTVDNTAFSTTVWGTNTKDDATNSFVLANWGNAVGWEYWWSDKLDISSYNRLVVKLKNVAAHPFVKENYTDENGETKERDTETVNYDETYYPGIELRIFGKKDESTDAAGFYKVALTTDNNYQATVDLSGGLTTNADGEEGMDLSMINSIRFWAWAQNTSVTIEEMYLEKPGTPNFYLVRNNEEADKYGTICLPFPAAVPENATIYSVAGVDSKDNPSALYLSEENTMEAGVAYIFKSSDDQDITFTGSAESLSENAATDNALVGVFNSKATVPANNYILSSNQWKKVVNTNTVKNYRAYLNLTGIDEASVKGFVSMNFDGTATRISSITNHQSSISFDLSGRRVSLPTKGLYIVNGKLVLK